jgi:hypothetical protein
MNIKAIFLENKAASSLALTFVLGTAVLGYLTWSAWDNYGSATADYSSKASTLDQLSHKEVFPSDSNLKKISETLSDNQANLDKLRKALEAFHVATFGEFDKIKPQDQPQYFQDTLRSEVTAIRTLATTSGATLPPTFYLGLDDYENHLPQPEQLPLLSRQLTVLEWLGKSISGLKGAIVADFSLIPTDKGKQGAAPGSQRRGPNAPSATTPEAGLPYETLGSMRITLRCDQGEFRDLINALSAAPYFLVIEDIKIQNSSGEPPMRDTAPAAPDQPSADGSQPAQRLPIIVGRETINVYLKIRMIDFPSTPNPSKPTH